MTSEDAKAIPLLEINDPPPVEIQKERKKNNLILKLVFAALVILVVILIVALIMSLLKKGDDRTSSKKETKEIKKVERKRKSNPYWNNYDLPNFLKPNHYDITLQLLKEANNLKEHNSSNYFFGSVDIDITMLRDSRFVVLNTISLEIKYTSINYVSRNTTMQSLHVVEIINDDIFNQTIFVCKEMLQKSSNYSIKINYSGNITLTDSGVVRTFYKNFHQKKQYGFLYSKLEPFGARAMFPCFDEPDKKALFKMKIIHYSKYLALSNMPPFTSLDINEHDLIFQEKDISKNFSLKLSTFNSTTIYMSTYLVAFVLLEDYEFASQERSVNSTVRIWVPKGLMNYAYVPLLYSISSENFLEKYLNFSSPFPKTDHVYIPNFVAGAMENWGLITYREKFLLLSQIYDEVDGRNAFNTIAHELAHIWFGNWVTMKTWQDIWLNEGFATYFASLAYFKQLSIPVEKSMELYTFEYRKILEKDGKPNSFPVRLPIVKVGDLFNSFIYSKGEALLIWLNSIMGEQNFRLAIQSYIKKYSQSNPTTEQFFNEMQFYGPTSISFKGNLNKYFEPWLNKVGYPILTVNYDISKQQIILSQHSVVTNSSKNDIWPIYTTYKTDQKPLNEPIYLIEKHSDLDLALGKEDFILINSNGYSYLRVNYSTYLWEKIIESIKNQNANINPINKIILFDDALYFAESGLMNASIAKQLVDTLINETNVIPWTLFYNRICTKIYNLLSNDQIYLKWIAYVKRLSKMSLDKALIVGLDDKIPVDDEIFQKQIFKINIEVDNQKVLTLLSNIFQAWRSSLKVKPLPKHLVNEILYYGIRENDKEEYWIEMWKMMKDNDLSISISKEQLAIGLTATSRAYRLDQLLNYILTRGTHNSDTDKQAFLNSVVVWLLKSNNGFNVLSRWVQNNTKKIKRNAFGDNIPDDATTKHFDKLLEKIIATTYDNRNVEPLLLLHSNKETLTKIVLKNNAWRENVKKFLQQHL